MHAERTLIWHARLRPSARDLAPGAIGGSARVLPTRHGPAAGTGLTGTERLA
jgi:hypothetical protein